MIDLDLRIMEYRSKRITNGIPQLRVIEANCSKYF